LKIYGGENKKKIGQVLQVAILISLFGTVGSISLLLNCKHLTTVLVQDRDVAVYFIDELLEAKNWFNSIIFKG